MPNNKLILRTLISPYSDETKGSVLSHDDVDNNFIFLKGGLLQTGYTSGNNFVLTKIDGTSINVDITALNTGSTNSWSITGNTGTTVGTNFIGTIGTVGLMFKVDSIQSGYIDIIHNNTSLGQNSMLANITGSYNSAFGLQSLYSNTSGGSNTAFGYVSLLGNTTGSFNSAFGTQSLQANITGVNNSAFGYQSLQLNNGDYNCAFGMNSLVLNSSGGYNIGVGGQALYNNLTGNYNTAVGNTALFQNTAGLYNVAIGNEALYDTTGSANTAIGNDCLSGNLSGSYNIGIGSRAGHYSTTASTQIFINSVDRGSYIGDQTASPIYIQQSGTIANQKIFLNGALLNLSGTTRNITTSTTGTFINGQTLDTASITTSNVGTFISASMAGTGSTALASGLGSFILGNGAFHSTTSTPASTTVSSLGAGFLGNNVGSTVLASGQGSLIQGMANRNTIMVASGAGSSVMGYTTDTGAVGGASMIASGLGSMARGSTQNTGTIESSGQGSLASGRASGPLTGTSRLMATAQGSHAFGNAEVGGDIICTAAGGLVSGQAESDSILSSTGGHGSFVFGWSTGGGTITTSANASFVGGYSSGDILSNTGDGSFLWGQGITNTIANTFKVGWGSDTLVVKSGLVGVNITPTSTLHSAGSFATNYLKVTANTYNILSTDYTLSVNNGASNWTIILPNPTTCLGRIYIIKRFDDTSVGSITIDSNGGSVQDANTGIFGATTILGAIGNVHAMAMFQSNGTNWEWIK